MLFGFCYHFENYLFSNKRKIIFIVNFVSMSEDKELKQMVTEMHKALIGDEYRKEGIVHKVDNHETRLTRLERYVIGLSAIGGFIFVVIKIGSQIKLW